ncbi:methyltransferase [Neptunicella marina]|uniref:Ribosomal RNA large subunit methyltransferase G n=1 Tax=Neptunicella marina TaxID=2125989 RepID=A0A8J6LWX0_9ALTE|nr:methyltransferase [Neptunicella marina]MBC3765399.1 methyltransferase [Neptunicella marina]
MTSPAQPNSILTLGDHTLKLFRYPKQFQHNTLQAWDSSDELLIDHILSNIKPTDTISVFNDDFGALACALYAYQPDWYNDSFVSECSLKQNLQLNKLSTDAIKVFSSLSKPAPSDYFLIKLPKSLALLEQQLIDVQQVASTDSQIIATGKTTTVTKAVLALFEKYIGTTTTSLARKKSRLVFSGLTVQQRHQSPYPTTWTLPDNNMLISNLANVFSRQSLDIGGRFLLQHLPDCSNKNVIDLGCGNGIIGLSVLAKFNHSNVTFVDESRMAVASAHQNVQTNIENGLNRARFLLSNCLEQVSDTQADIILCNPPFHQNNTITSHIARQMFDDSYRHLNSGGELRIVGNRHLNYGQMLKKRFGGFKVVASNNKFSILSCIKR